MIERTFLLLAIAFYLIAGIAQAQQTKKVPPPPKPPDEEPSLAVTMKFVQDKLTEQDPLGYVVTFSSAAGTIFRRHENRSDVRADATACTLHGAVKQVQDIEVSQGATYQENGQPVTGDDLHSSGTGSSTISLKDVEKITVDSYQEEGNRFWAKQAHPEVTITVVPPIFVLALSASKPVFTVHYAFTRGKQPPKEGDSSGKEISYSFDSEETANRIAKALTHAVELCGGGNKDPF
jgi:hypothetical protein